MAVKTANPTFQSFRGTIRAKGGIIRDFAVAPNRRLNGLSDRLELKWVAGQRGKPALNADIQNVLETVRMIADPDFEVLGTNATSSSVAFAVTGGVTLTTAGADGDAVILLPHLDANQSGWTQFTWGTSKSVEWECEIATGASIASMACWAGLKLTQTGTVATDDDQVYLRYQSGVTSGNWVVVSSIANTDTQTDTGIAVAVSTRYRIKIRIDSARKAYVYLSSGASPATGADERVPNWTLLYTTAALTSVNLIPYIGVSAQGAAAAKALTVYGEAISKTIG